jgi:hypothetical protein
LRRSASRKALTPEKNTLTAADLLNDRVLPFFEEQGIPLLRVLNGIAEPNNCGVADRHPYELYLAVREY